MMNNDTDTHSELSLTEVRIVDVSTVHIHHSCTQNGCASAYTNNLQSKVKYYLGIKQ